MNSLKRWGAGLALTGTVAVGAGAYATYNESINFEPLASVPEKIENDPSTLVCADIAEPCTKENALAVFANRPKIPVQYDKLDPQVQKDLATIFISSEDHRFLEHDGVDKPGLVAAMLGNARCLCFARGASTIDRQGQKLVHPEPTDQELAEAVAGKWAVELPHKLSDDARKVPAEIYEIRLARAVNRDLTQKYQKMLAGRPGVGPDDIKTLVKREIFNDYINNVPFGRGAIGIGAAAKAFFNKDVNSLTFEEIMLLVSNLPGPASSEILVSAGKVTPEIEQNFKNFVIQKDNEARKDKRSDEELYLRDGAGNIRSPQGRAEINLLHTRTLKAIEADLKQGKISQQVADEHADYAFYVKQSRMSILRYNGIITKLLDQNKINRQRAAELRANYPKSVPYFPETKRDYTRANSLLARQAVDMALQEAARQINASLPEGEDKWSTDTVKSANVKVYTTFKPAVQGALAQAIRSEVALQRDTEADIAAINQGEDGAVLGLIGSRYPDSELNTTTRPRDIGSVFKPFIYAAYYKTGKSPTSRLEIPDKLEVPGANGSASLMIDSGQTCERSGQPPTCTAESAVKDSDNIGAGQAAIEGGLDEAVEIAEDFGLEIRDDWTASIILGTEAKPLQVNNAMHGMIVRQGETSDAYTVRKVTGHNGRPLSQHKPHKVENVLPRDVAKDVATSMVAVVQEGTAAGAIMPLRGPEFAAAKTGTGNEGSTKNIIISTCDPKYGMQTTTFAVSNRNNNYRVRAYDSSRELGRTANRFFMLTPHSNTNCSIVEAFDQ